MPALAARPARWSRRPRDRRARHGGLVVHETKLLDLAWCTFVDGIPVTGPALTLVGIAATCGPTVLELAVDDALRRGLTQRSEVWALLGRIGAKGRNGVGVLRALLEQHEPRAAVPESVQETRLVQALRARGLPEPALQHEVRDPTDRFVARVDLAYPEHRIAIEYDSYRHHGGRRAIVRDGERRNRLTAVGWVVLTATHAEVEAACRTLVPAIRAAMARTRPSGVARSRTA